MDPFLPLLNPPVTGQCRCSLLHVPSSADCSQGGTSMKSSTLVWPLKLTVSPLHLYGGLASCTYSPASLSSSFILRPSLFFILLHSRIHFQLSTSSVFRPSPTSPSTLNNTSYYNHPDLVPSLAHNRLLLLRLIFNVVYQHRATLTDPHLDFF